MTLNRRDRKLFDALVDFDDELVDAIFTTYNFDAPYFESVLLPKLLDVRSDDDEDQRSVAIDLIHKLSQTQISVICDGKANRTLKKSLFGYDLIPVFGATQHSKIFILRFPKSFRVILGSANLTESGIHRNQEVYTEIDFDEHSESWPLFFDILKYLEELSAANGDRLKDQIGSWRNHAISIAPKEKSDTAAGVKFIGITPNSVKISLSGMLGDFFKDFGIVEAAHRRVDEIRILAPFFEEGTEGSENADSTLLSKEYFALKGDHPRYPALSLYLPTSNEAVVTRFPQSQYGVLADRLKDKFEVISNPIIVSGAAAGSADAKDAVGRFPHGKLFVVRNSSGFSMSMLGSSNFSPSAFGVRGKGKNNWEANICYFLEEGSDREVNAMFPKRKVLDEDFWRERSFVTQNEENDPDSSEEITPVLCEANYRDGKLSLKSLTSDPQDYQYFIGSELIDVRWLKELGESVIAGFKSLSVEVRDKNNKQVQLLPVFFEDQSFKPLEMEITRAQLVSWIEERYLYSRQMPLSLLLQKFNKGVIPTLRGSSLDANVNTDEFLVYRVKAFNHLVSKIQAHLTECQQFPKRVEYHLNGEYGLIQCIGDYLEKARTEPKFETFFLYQAVEVATSVLLALAPDVVDATRESVRRFWDNVLVQVTNFETTAGSSEQWRMYHQAIAKLGGEVFTSSAKPAGDINVAV